MRALVFCLSLACLLAGCTEIQQAAQEIEAKETAQNDREQRIQNANLDKPEYVLSVGDIANEFSSNSVMAENKYMDRVVELSGTVGSIDDSAFDQESVTVSIRGGEYDMDSVSCNMNRNAEAVKIMQKGMSTIVRGVVTSESTGVELSRCNFWLNDENRWVN